MIDRNADISRGRVCMFEMFMLSFFCLYLTADSEETAVGRGMEQRSLAGVTHRMLRGMMCILNQQAPRTAIDLSAA